MSFEFKFPDVGEGIHEGVLVRWLVKEGDAIKEDQVLAEVETDKAVVEIPSPKAGMVLKLHFDKGQTVPVGQTLVTIDTGEKDVSPTAAVPVPPASQSASTAPTVVGALSDQLFSSATAQRASQVLPRLRELAKQLGVDIERVVGTGVGGRITEADVHEAASAASSNSRAGMAVDAEKYGPTRREPFSGTRKSIADRLLRTTQHAPIVSHFDVADVTAPAAKGGSIMPRLMQISCAALKKFPMFNSSIDEANGEIVTREYYHIGIAVDTEHGLMVPVIRDADKKTLEQLSAELKELAVRARERKLAVEDMRGGCFTLSNVGYVGGMFATPIMNWPQSAILALGRMRDTPVVRDGHIVIGKQMPLSLSFDHRLIDGADAARFINFFIEQLAI